MHDERHGNKINRLISTRFIDQPLAPFIRKLENWIDVSPAETRDLVAATARERSFKSAETLVCAEQERCPVAILRRGIAAAYSLLPNGKRHISSVYFPGDLLTYHNFQTGRAMHEFVMVTSSELVFLNSEKFDRALHEHPHIAQITR